MLDHWISLLIRGRWFFATLLIAAMAASLWIMPQLNFSFNLGRMLRGNDAQDVDVKEFYSTFPPSDGHVMLSASANRVLTVNDLRTTQLWAEKLEALPEVKAVISPELLLDLKLDGFTLDEWARLGGTGNEPLALGDGPGMATFKGNLISRDLKSVALYLIKDKGISRRALHAAVEKTLIPPWPDAKIRIVGTDYLLQQMGDLLSSNFRSLILCLFALSPALFAASPEVTWREILATPLVREDFMETPEEFAAVIPPRAVAAEGIRPFTEVLKAIYETFDQPPTTHYFFCTVYYTPREAGFTKERGFKTTPDSLRALRSKKYPHDFVKATYVEGFGRLAEPQNGRPYLSYDGKFHTRILGNRNNTLLDRESIAVHRGNPLFGKTIRAWILDPEMYNQFGAVRFQVGDTGGGLYKSQIDLYWGKDDPLGPGADVWRPASCDVAVSWMVPVLVW